jgi:hypothetical protein
MWESRVARDVYVGTAALGCPFERKLEGVSVAPSNTPSGPPKVILRELFRTFARIPSQEDAMRAYLAKLTPKAAMLLAVPVLAVAYPIVMIVIPAMVRAVVPNVVRSVLNLM